VTEGKAMARYNVDLQDNEGNAYQIMANPDSVAEFSPAVNRENIRSGETYRVIFGKIMKYFSEVGNAAYVGLANNCTTTIAGFALDARQGKELMDRINELNRDLNQRFPDGTGLQWDGTNFWGTTADGMKVKLGSLTYRDFTATPTANSGSMSIDISDIPNYKDLILWETLFPRMLSDLDMANWNTSMLRTGVGYDWNYDADKGILSISSRHTECVLIQYGTGLKQRTVRVHYI
jgi:hypothetical protein